MELFNKNELVIYKVNECYYKVNCKVENPNLLLNEMFTFEWLQVLLELHPDFIETYKVFKEDENNAKVFVVLKHFFKDFGVPRVFFYLHAEMDKSNPSKIIVKQVNEIPDTLIENDIKREYLQIPVNDSIGYVMINSPSSIFIKANIHLQYFIPKLEFVEKMAIILSAKILLKTKQFIENLEC